MPGSSNRWLAPRTIAWTEAAAAAAVGKGDDTLRLPGKIEVPLQLNTVGAEPDFARVILLVHAFQALVNSSVTSSSDT